MKERKYFPWFLLLLFLGINYLNAQTLKDKREARWIWFPEGKPQIKAPDTPFFFRKTFSAPQDLFGARISISVDNEYILYVNGKEIGKGSDWMRADNYDISHLISPGKNCVAVRGKNQGGPAGLICSIGFITANGDMIYIDSDGSWLSSPGEEPGWMNPDFNDSQWKPSIVLGSSPDLPWGEVKRNFGRIISLELSPDSISPNNDEFNDSLDIILNNLSGMDLDIRIDILDQGSKTIATRKGKTDKTERFSWDGRNNKGEAVFEGNYTCSAQVSHDKMSLNFKEGFKVKNQRFLKKSPNIMKDVFPIGVWFDGRVEGINCNEGYHNVPFDKNEARKYYEENFTDIKNHNIDLIVIPNTPPEYREILLSAADRVGVKIVLEIVEFAYEDTGGKFSVRHPQMEKDESILYEYCKKIVEPLMRHPSLFCYQILDEPSAELFPNFQRTSRILEDIDPARPSFSCLCREDELHRTSRMGTRMMVFDRYPLWKGTKPGEYDFKIFVDLLDMLKASAREIPYWMVVQTCAMDREKGLRYPAPEELRLMAYLSLAHNAKGIFYFLHNSCTQEEKLLGLVDLDLKPHPLYNEAAALAAEIKTLSPLLLTLKPRENLVSFDGDFDVQTFENPNGETFVFVTNLNVLKSGEFTGIIWDSQQKEIQYLQNALTGDKVTFNKVKEGMAFHLKPKPGEGLILRLARE
jgi:hypothetical protein